MNEQTIFTAALERSLAERSAFLDEVCGTDGELRERVENLLRLHENAGDFLEIPAAGTAPTIDQPIAERAGTQIGPYKLLQQIGEGGMGVVYMAEQKEPVERRVALKIIKPGMDTRQVVGRFEAERQALAMMDHPNIAKVLDAGATDSGRPYFVMELVKGIPITEYCDENHLTTKERLELFVPILQAVQHAHQKGIIHRDLKPSNVMIAEYDDHAVPKIIDFGVAKATGHKLTEKTMFTQYGQLVGTLEYMSPEQAKLNQLDIDTRSDIYSLGVLLYELLIGTTPFDRTRLQSAAFDEMLRIIREEEPPRPSTRLSTIDTLPSVAANRQVEPGKLGQSLKGELDWIVMKALEKDRARRYETASKFAEDVQHYLNDEAVSACPPSPAYRFRKFARRNRKTVALGAAFSLMLAVCVAVVGASIGWAARDRSARQAVLEQQIAHALEDVQASYARCELSEAVAEVKRAKGLMAAAGDESDELHDRVRQWHVDLEIAIRLEEIRLQKECAVNFRLDAQQTDRVYRKAFQDYDLDFDALTASEAAERIRDSQICDRLVAGLDDWVMAKWKGKLEDGATLMGIARQADPDPWRDRLRAAFVDRDWDSLAELAGAEEVTKQPLATILLLTLALREAGQGQEAIDLLRRAQRAHPEDFWFNLYLGKSLWRRAKRLPQPRSRRQALAEVVGFHRAALALRPTESYAHSAVAECLQNLGGPYWSEAEYRYLAAMRLNDTNQWAHSNLAGMLIQQDRFVEAEEHLRRAIEIEPEVPHFYYSLRNALRGQGKMEEADAAFMEILRHADRLPGWGKKDLRAKLRSLLATTNSDIRDYECALEVAKKLTELSPDNGADWNFFAAMAHWQLGNQAEARQCYARGAAWLDVANHDEDQYRFRDEVEGLMGIGPAEREEIIEEFRDSPHDNREADM